MKNSKIIIALFISFVSFLQCKAQQVYPLNTLLENIPQGGYVKDLNNELNPFVGTYKANYQGNEITLYITKIENKLEKSTNKTYYMDALIVKYIVKNSSGFILQNTQNTTSNIELYSFWIISQYNTVALLYSGTNCGVGWGKVYLSKLNSTQLSWDYRPNDMILDQYNCPGNPDVTIYLPVTKDLIFTKQ